MQSITWVELQTHFNDFVKKTYDAETATKITDAVDWQAWIYGPGANPQWGDTSFVTQDGTDFEALADGYIALGGKDHPANYDIYNQKGKEDPQLKVIFLNRLVARQDVVTLEII